jgi:hypothetical protein
MEVHSTAVLAYMAGLVDGDGKGLIPQDIAERREVIAAQIKELNRTGDPHAVAVQGRDPIH